MRKVYRVLRKAYARSPLDGEGAFLYGGRWSSPGTRLAYTSEHQSLAMLEYFVHLDPGDAPPDLVLVTAELPDDLPAKVIAADELPASWRRSPAPAELARIGDEFVAEAKHCVLVVPSALAPHENNWLLNPQHRDFRRVAVHGVEALSYDPRMFAPQGRRPRKG
ncbi:MAG TPA: RES family NAD+ phosphorylase [Candidatus Sulfotelmatobacter sp.]|nr:RES family NAD+ phosphorylase [Candidatus Sulfotelmatobacter sp.]